MSNVLMDALYSIYPRSNGQVRIIKKELDALEVATVIVLLPTYKASDNRYPVAEPEPIEFVSLNSWYYEPSHPRFAMPELLTTHSWFTGVMVGAGWTTESVWGALAQLSEPVQIGLGLIEDKHGEKPAVARGAINLVRGESNA